MGDNELVMGDNGRNSNLVSATRTWLGAVGLQLPHPLTVVRGDFSAISATLSQGSVRDGSRRVNFRFRVQVQRQIPPKTWITAGHVLDILKWQEWEGGTVGPWAV